MESHFPLTAPQIIPALKINPSIQPHAHSRRNEKNERPTCTGKYLEDAASLTVAAPLIMSPQYSCMLQGLQMMFEPSGGGMFDGLGHGLGFITFLAGIPLLVIKPVIAIPVTLGGAIGTAVLAPVYAGEVAVRKTVKAFTSMYETVTAPSEADTKRRLYTEKFVARMNALLAQMPTFERAKFQNNPKVLVSLSVTAVAFLSRRLEGNKLMVGGAVLNKSELTNMNDEVNNYFDRICEIKNCFRDLELSLDDHHAWDYFIKIALDDNFEKSELEKHTLEYMIKRNEELNNLICEDPIFQEIWQESKNQ